MDANGKVTTDPFKSDLLYPIGGDELHSGFKGFGLAMLVEILCGILADANYGHKIRKWGSTGEEANLGQCFMAINPEFFAPGFEGRMSDLNEHIRNLLPVFSQRK